MQSRRSVLIVDRDPNFRRNAGRFLRDRGFEVVDAAHPALGLSLAEAEAPAFVLLDLGMTDPSGLAVLETMIRLPSRPQVVGMAGQPVVSEVVEAIRLGALDVFERPVDGERLVALLQSTHERLSGGRPKVARLKTPLNLDLFVAESPSMRAAMEKLRAQCQAPVLLLEGEPGAGLSVLARFAHSIGPRSEGPFVVVAQDPAEGKAEDYLFGSGETTSAFAEAKGGLVFIESVCGLSAEGQERFGKLLQGLLAAKTSGAEVRWPPMIGGAERDIQAEVEAGRLHPDIGQAFSVNRVQVPPLRHRREDIPELIRRITIAVQQASGAAGISISPRVMEELVARDWPGNLPELVEAVQGSCVIADGGLLVLEPSARERPVVETQDELEEAEEGWRPSLDPTGEVQPYDIYEAEIFRFALENAGGCVSRAAELLGVGRATMYRKMRAYNIDVPPVSERAIARSRGARQRRQEERAAAEARRRAFLEKNAS